MFSIYNGKFDSVSRIDDLLHDIIMTHVFSILISNFYNTVIFFQARFSRNPFDIWDYKNLLVKFVDFAKFLWEVLKRLAK